MHRFTDLTAAGWILPALCCLALGCSEYEPIRRYTVERPPPEHRMWGAILPHSDFSWFFKVTGPNQSVAARAPELRSFLTTVRFQEDGQPAWELPAGWRQRPADRMRFATLEIAADERASQLEMSITRLPTAGASPTEKTSYLLQNINRWRGQLGLLPLAVEQLAENSVALPLAGTGQQTATIVEFAGTLDSAGRGPLAGPAAPPSSRGGSRPRAPQISYDRPAGWETGELVRSRGGVSIPRAAAFTVGSGAEQAEITVTSLPTRGAAGQAYVASNVNRWRQQLGLPAAGDDQLELQPVELAGLAGSYVEIVGAQQSILGVIALDDSTAWFAKLQGSVDLALAERDRFKEFVASIEIDN